MTRLFVILFLLTSIAFSQNYNIDIKLKDGNIVSYSLEDIKRLEFKDITSLIENSEQDQVIENFQLKQNYPNPFNPTTIIEYQIPNSAKISIDIFDIRGKLVKQLINGIQAEGTHQVTWDGTNQFGSKVSSGIYIYSIRFGNRQLSRQMILLK